MEHGAFTISPLVAQMLGNLYGRSYRHAQGDVSPTAHSCIFDRSELLGSRVAQTLPLMSAPLAQVNIWSEKKIHEKLNCMHHNPVGRELVTPPGDWSCSRHGGEILLP
jgi:hypothetical protein